MKKHTILTSVLLLSALGSPLAKATVITSSSDSGLAGATVETFSSATLGSYTTLTLGGVTITGSPNVVVANTYAGQYNTTGNYLDNNEGASSTVRFTFASPTAVVGFNYGALDDTWTLNIYNAANVLLGTTTVAANGGSNAGEFIGLSSNSANIAYATFVDSSTGDWILLDNLMYGEYLATVTAIYNTLQVDAIALNLRGINLGAIDTATRDVNGRLYRLRAFGSDQSTDGQESSQSATMDSKGKLVLPVQPTRHLEFFAQGDFGSTDRETSNGVAGYGGWTEASTAGVEYGLTNHLTAGLGLGYVHNKTTVADGAGKVTLDGAGVSTYASWVKNNFYVDGLYNFALLNNDIHRDMIGGGVADGSTNNYSNKVELNAGRNFNAKNGLVFGPTASVKYVHGYLAGYTDGEGVTVDSQTYDSLVSEIGAQASLPKTVRFGRITPQVRVGWGHEYLNDSRPVTASLGDITATATTPGPVRDYALIGAGVMAEIGKRTSVVLDYQANISENLVYNVFSVRAAYQF